MNKDDALKLVATHGYNVGYGAKKHFSTYDIVEKIPGLIGFISIAFGVLSLKYFDQALESHASVVLTLFGVVSLYISFYLRDKEKYKATGTEITKFYSQLHSVYLNIKSEEVKVNKGLKEVEAIMDQFYQVSIGKQILFSDWYAHYKFFVQMQIDWIEEQKDFGFFKDKLPKSAQLALLSIIVFLLYKYVSPEILKLIQ